MRPYRIEYREIKVRVNALLKRGYMARTSLRVERKSRQLEKARDER
jgi:hypothetical protein